MSDQVRFSLDFKILNLLIQLKVTPGYRNTYVGPLNEIVVFNAQPRHMTLDFSSLKLEPLFGEQVL